jgi:signal transduction histidine kinase
LILACLTAVAGLCISVYIRSRIAQTEATTARLTAETLRQNTEQELDLFVEVLESVRALHALSAAVNQAAMDEFIEKGLVHQHTVLGAFGLTQRISPWLRAVLEEQTKENPETGYRFLQKGPDETWVPAETRNAYYPLTWQNRKEALNIPVGFDFSSLSDALPTIDRIEQTRRTAVVPSPIRNLSAPLPIGNRAASELGFAPAKQRSGNQQSAIGNFPPPSYWVFAPVIPWQTEANPMYTPDTVIGFAVAVLHPETILKRVAARSSVSSPGLRLHLMTPPDLNAKETIRIVNGAWLYRCPLEAIDAQWIFECSLPLAVTSHRSAAALAAGLIITALMTSQLLILGGRTRKIEAEVRARTEDLRIANVRLEENLHERARLEEEMNELAARERRRIGRDLHDSLGQKLTGAVFLSRSLLDYLGQRGSEQQTHAKTLNETLKSAVSQVRNMARGLAPVTLNDESLCEALGQLAEEMTGLYGVSCEIAECDELSALGQKTKEQLYLIAREAVNNAARHAQAGHVTVRLTGGESGWKLCVEDDGKGLSGAQQPAGEGMGIRIMRHRAGLIGAKFTINSVPGRGTCVEITSIA